MNGKERLCINCFRIVRGDYEVCPYCGFTENGSAKEACQLRPGTILADRYIIGEVIGQGGFGITYKGFDTNLGSVVAVKEFYPSRCVSRAENEARVSVFSGERKQEYKAMLKRFLEEARNAALFWNEPDIVNVLAYFEQNGTAYMIMEYIEGILLKQRLEKEGRLKPQEASIYMCAILQALSKIHEKGMIHRDISPDNIFLTGENTIKLLDFGTARFQQGESGASVVVKPGYSAPEQYRSKVRQDSRLDIYSTGAVYFRMLTGFRPAEALDRMEKDVLAFPEHMEVSARLKEDILKAMALDPEKRFATAEAFRLAIEEHSRLPQKGGFFDRFRR